MNGQGQAMGRSVDRMKWPRTSYGTEDKYSWVQQIRV